jgi:putative transcriptional regulator
MGDSLQKPRPRLFERLVTSMEETQDFARGEKNLRQVRVTIPDPPPDYSATTIRAIRERLGHSQSSFSRLLNVSLRTVQRWELGEQIPGHASARLLQLLEQPKLFESMTTPDNVMTLIAITHGEK